LASKVVLPSFSEAKRAQTLIQLLILPEVAVLLIPYQESKLKFLEYIRRAAGALVRWSVVVFQDRALHHAAVQNR
jgi:hypothetical protein